MLPDELVGRLQSNEELDEIEAYWDWEEEIRRKAIELAHQQS